MGILTKPVTRVVVIVYLAMAVGIVWRWAGLSSWADGLDIATAGEQFTTWVEPLGAAATNTTDRKGRMRLGMRRRVIRPLSVAPE